MRLNVQNVYLKLEVALAKQVKGEYENLMKLVRYRKANKSEKFEWQGKAASFNQ